MKIPEDVQAALDRVAPPPPALCLAEQLYRALMHTERLHELAAVQA